MQVFGDITLTWRHKGLMTILTVAPTYTLHNNTTYNLHVSPSLFHSTAPESDQPGIVESVKSQTSTPLLFWQFYSLARAEEMTQIVKIKSVGGDDTPWSLPLSLDFVRHSFSLATSHGRPAEVYVPSVLTTHDHCSYVYVVVAKDTSPRLLLQNLTSYCLEAVEAGANGIHASTQLIPPSCQVAYEPPTFARQYPVVFDREATQAKDKDLEKCLKKVSIKFRLCQEKEINDNDGEKKWSEPFNLISESDRILSISEKESIFISTHKEGTTLYLNLLPTSQVASLNSALTTSESGEREMNVSLDLKLTEVVVCLDDETAAKDSQSIDEVLQIIANGLVVQYNCLERLGRSIEFTLELLHVNNMTVTRAGEFAVVIIPRDQHSRRASLIESDPVPLAKLSLLYNANCSSLIDDLRVSIQPLTLQIEDGLINRLRLLFQSFGAPGVLVKALSMKRHSEVPDVVLQESQRDAIPLAITRLAIEPFGLYLSARISLKVLVSCNDSPFRFGHYQLENIYSNWTEVSQTIASRYLMSTVAHVGWLLGSLELIGSPGTFIQNVGRGVRDLVTLPYEGLTRSPGWFLLGIGHGTVSFMHHVSLGALRSVTSMASSISQNMEQLSMDPHHISFQAQQRQERPATHFTAGLVTGASSFGLSLMSAVAGTELEVVTQICSANLSEHIRSCSAIAFKQLITCIIYAPCM